MALQIRRGTAADRTTFTPAEGELLYTTDTKLVYVGDGSTAGGNVISGGGGGIVDIVQDTTPQLGGNLDVQAFGITTSTTDGSIYIAANGNGGVVFNDALAINSAGNITKNGILNISPTSLLSIGRDDLAIDGNLFITRNTHSTAFGAGFTFSQHHNVADSVNFNFYRTRGTGVAPTSLQNGDDLIDITFFGYDGTNRIASGGISAVVDGTVATGIVPGRLQFLVHDGVTVGNAGGRVRAEVRSDGHFRIDKLGGLTSTTITLPVNNSIRLGDVQLTSDGLSTFNSNANLYITANANGRVYLDGSAWPTTLGSVGQVLTTDGAGSLSWSNAPGYVARTTASGSTGNIADAATANISITGFKTYSLLKIESTHAAWIRLYVSEAARTADASRAEGVDPAPGAGVIAEIVTTGSQTILMSPGVFGWNNESPITNAIACAITNKSGSLANITVTLTLIQLEA